MVVFSLISLGVALVVLAPVALVGIAVFSSADWLVALFLFFPLAMLLAFALLVLVFVPLSIVYQLALRELVLGERRVFGSIGNGFDLFWRNLGTSLLAGVSCSVWD